MLWIPNIGYYSIKQTSKGGKKLNKELHEEYAKTRFSEEVNTMFLKILKQTEPLAFNVLVEIGKNEKAAKKLNIQQLSDSIQVVGKVRKSKKGKGYYFVEEQSTLNRRRAERIVDKLVSMSLVYTVNESFYKLLYLTPRGNDLIKTYIKSRTTN